MILGNLDVWTEILSHLHIYLPLDQKEVIGEKRRALLCVALLSPTLTGLALEHLWRSMASLEPVRLVINSSCAGGQEQLRFLQDNQGGYWVLQEPLSQEQRIRASGYLSHIHNFHFQLTTGTRETSLWSMLSVSLGLSGTVPLIPNLKSLSLDFRGSNGGVATWLHSMTPLMSPSLGQVSYMTTLAHAGGVEVFQAMLKSQSIELSSLYYHGPPSPRLLECFLFFNGLESLTLDFILQGMSIQRYTQSAVTIADIFDQSPHLKALRVDLRLFPLRDPVSLGKRMKVDASPALRSLHVTGDASDLHSFLLDGVTSSSLSTLTIFIAQASELVWKSLCDRASVNFPKMRNLTLQAQPGSGVPQLLLQDISSIISRATMQSFQIDTIPHCLADANITGLVSSWPELKSFAILNDYSSFLSAKVLIEISQLPHLQYLALPLDLSQLGTPLLYTPHTDCPLQELKVIRYSAAPTTLDGKIDLARNILMLFPAIESISGVEASQNAYMGELHKLIRAFHSVVAIQTHRTASRHRVLKEDKQMKRPKIGEEIGVAQG
ncbi:hypothetical protein D9756_008521 [Leucocoprinus leucothites]|uniref:Uncharacterized protein n=1 Tax=Leucocoprinus leucothites TaxID=201217 RepID=A0A8H5FVW8_9AGAR|nr:hypothetical protein D9756_008521 [Leucoagaricus leucothites]